MAFTADTDLSVLNIRLTTKGREQLSKGRLKFSKFAVGDSEIDYTVMGHKVKYFEEENEVKIKTLRPVDLSPNIISFLEKNPDGETKTEIGGVPSNRTIISNQRESIGCFVINGNDVVIKSELVKNSDASVVSSNNTNVFTISLDGGASPSVGDFILIKDNQSSGTTITLTSPSPHLFYKVENVAGTTITVDRNVPSSFTGNHAIIFSENIGEELYGTYPSDYFFNDEVEALFNNFNCNAIFFPYWKFSLITTKNIPGVNSFPDNEDGDDKTFLEYKTTEMAGFVNYIQNHNPKYSMLGVIHYTNPSPSNVYAEGLHNGTVVIDIPTIMWDKKENSEMGIKLLSHGIKKHLMDENPALNVGYYDLVDEYDNVVGKIFNGLKIIVIEDQELLFAMSYKSNRSWTLSKQFVSITS